MTDKERQFLDAASKGYIRKLAALLESGINVDVQDERGCPTKRTALMHAAEKGHLRVVDFLLKAGAKVNAIDKGFPIDCPGGNTALILAIRSCHIQVAHRLLHGGASPKTKGGGTSVISATASLGDEGLFRRLIASGADMQQRDGSGITPISAAVQTGNLGITRFLLAHGVDPGSPTPGGSPVLVDAALGGRPDHVEVCKALVEAGADPNLGSEDNLDSPNGCLPLRPSRNCQIPALATNQDKRGSSKVGPNCAGYCA